MKLRLNTLGALRVYWNRDDGKYPPPADVFTLGTPDNPPEDIEVRTGSANTAREGSKWVYLVYPYKRLMSNNAEKQSEMLFCKSENKTGAEWYLEARSTIMDGAKGKELIDCNRGIIKLFLRPDDNPSSIGLEYFVSSKTVASDHYLRLCRDVTGKAAYLPAN